MKTCPACQRVYSDETIIFCLADGTELKNVTRNIDLDATWRLAPRIEPAPTQMAPQTDGAAQPLSTIQYHPELLGRPGESTPPAKVQSSRTVLPWIFAMVVVMALAGIFIAWIVTRDRGAKNVTSEVPTATPQPSISENSNSSAPAEAQKNQAVNSNSKVASKTSKSGANPLPLAVLNPSPTPVRKTTVKKESSSTAVVKPEKKKVESPKPTGESFIPVQRP